MRHDASLVKGDLYAYLGHFGRREFLEQGHNDIPNDAENQDAQLGNFLGSESPMGGGATSVLGNPL